MTGPGAPPIPAVVMQHVEEAAHLRQLRSTLLRAPQVRLTQLARADERIAAHLDGVAVAGACGVSLVQQALEQPGPGPIFVAAVRAIEDRDAQRLDQLLSSVEAVRRGRAGLISAFGWVAAADLKGITKGLLESAAPWRREVGLAACAMHGADPGAALINALDDPDAGLRARALRGAGGAGRLDLLGACLALLGDADPCCAFEAARAALMLGNRSESVSALEAIALAPGGEDRWHQRAAMASILKVIPPKRAQALLASLTTDPQRIRLLIHGIASAGDPHHVPWLLVRMRDPTLARVAGEAFSLLSGLDLVRGDFELKPPTAVEELGPSGDPVDGDVSMDEDDHLPWPDPDKLAAWWARQHASFTPGTRCFMGRPLTRRSCIEVLKTGAQRQRIAAAEHLCLLSPGTPLFNTAAPAWRQLRLLARVG
jgi:uncharacterized protein (TIGR02270 family)